MKCPICGNPMTSNEKSIAICEVCGFINYLSNDYTKHNKGKDRDRQRKEKKYDKWN